MSLTNALIQGLPFHIPSVSSSSFPILGSHYFAADGTPTFDLTAVREILFAKKLATVAAPKSAAAGPAGTGAVDWLALGDNGKGGSVGLGEVYRVETAGGNPPSSCEGLMGKDDKSKASVVSVQYAALYWFYG